MIVLSKKKMIFIGLLLCFSLAIVSALSTYKSPKVVTTSSLPVTNKVIVVDAGHGVPDEGAESSSRYYRGRNKS